MRKHVSFILLLGHSIFLADSLAENSPEPLITKSTEVYFEESFDPEKLSERLWYTADWKADDGMLKRLRTGSENTRIFLRDASYGDTLIRFDFRLGQAKDVRLMTGSGGGYNTVLHLRPDHFFLQTAMDSSVPWFSYRHSECAFDFEPDRWYTMTIEFAGDEAIAWLDHEHLVRAQHPIIDRRREYFALQVDEEAAAFDNVRIHHAVSMARPEAKAMMEAAVNRFPVEKSLDVAFEIREKNAHEWYYQRDETYRALVLRVDDLDTQRREQFPDAFRTHKEYTKAILQERKHLLETDPAYKELLHATHRAARAIDAWLINQDPGVDELPSNRKKSAIGQLKAQFSDAPEVKTLEEALREADAELEAAYPQLFLGNEEINAMKKAASEASKADPEYQRLSGERADAFHAKKDYLLTNDEELIRLRALLEQQEES